MGETDQAPEQCGGSPALRPPHRGLVWSLQECCLCNLRGGALQMTTDRRCVEEVLLLLLRAWGWGRPGGANSHSDCPLRSCKPWPASSSSVDRSSAQSGMTWRRGGTGGGGHP